MRWPTQRQISRRRARSAPRQRQSEEERPATDLGAGWGDRYSHATAFRPSAPRLTDMRSPTKLGSQRQAAGATRFFEWNKPDHPAMSVAGTEKRLYAGRAAPSHKTALTVRHIHVLVHAPGPPGMGTAQDGWCVDGWSGGWGGFGVPAMRFETAQDLIGEADGAEGIVAADPGPR